MKVRAAIIEDDSFLRKMLSMTLRDNEIDTEVFEDAESFMNYNSKSNFDIILLDIKLPGMSGEELLKELRDTEIQTPVIMLTGIQDVDYKIRTLSDGADDYLEKPINYDELIARVRAVIRRSQGRRELPTGIKLQIGQYELDTDSRMTTSNLGEVLLSEKEVKLIKFFCQKPDETLSRADILEEVWGMDEYPTNRTVDNFVLKLRKLYEEKPDEPVHFKTIRSVGYRFEP